MFRPMWRSSGVKITGWGNCCLLLLLMLLIHKSSRCAYVWVGGLCSLLLCCATCLKSFRENKKTVGLHQIGPRPLLSTSFPMHYSLYTAYSLNYWKDPSVFIPKHPSTFGSAKYTCPCVCSVKCTVESHIFAYHWYPNFKYLYILKTNTILRQFSKK
jgi:hypothetical protein